MKREMAGKEQQQQQQRRAQNAQNYARGAPLGLSIETLVSDDRRHVLDYYSCKSETENETRMCSFYYIFFSHLVCVWLFSLRFCSISLWTEL